MANVLHRTNKELRNSVNTPDYPIEVWIHNPDLSAVEGYDNKYWTITGDEVTLMSEAERTQVDINEVASIESHNKTSAKAVVDGADPVMEKVLTAIAEVIQDELQAIKNGTPITSRDMVALKQAVKDKIDG